MGVPTLHEQGRSKQTSDPRYALLRWMPVGKAGLQAQILREAVENQTPDIIICDEISTRWVP